MKASRAMLALGSCVLLSGALAFVSVAEQDTAGGVKPASEEIANDPAVREAWTDGGLTFRGAPDGEVGVGSSRLGAGTTNKRWRIDVYDYEQTTVLFTTTIGAGGDPPMRAAKAITRAVALLEQWTMTEAETRLSLGSTVLVRVRSQA